MSGILKSLKQLSALVLVFVFAVSVIGSTALMAEHKKGASKKDILTSAAVGAAIGGVLDGKSGAILGGVAGGAGRYAYGRVKRDRDHGFRSTGSSKKLIIAGTAAGAATGALVGGKKGALIGAAVGGVGSYVYDRKTDRRR